MYIILLLYLSTFINLLGQTYQDNSSRPTSAQVGDWSNQKFRLFEPTNIFLKARNITLGGAPDTIRVDKPRNTNVPPLPHPTPESQVAFGDLVWDAAVFLICRL